TPWNEVQMARHKDRPYTLDYIRMLFEDFIELHGDRTNSEDRAIIGGLANFQGRPVVVLGHQKGRDLKERQKRNFGSARPAGFRVLMLEHAVYSVIPPEGCAAILWNGRDRASEAAEALKLTARNALEFELVDEILREPLGGAHRDPITMASTLKTAIAEHLWN